MVVDRVGLVDIGCKGSFYTWSNRRNGDMSTSVKLDRGVANSAWKNLFAHASLSSTFATHLDHVPLVLQLDDRSRVSQLGLRKPWRFELY